MNLVEHVQQNGVNYWNLGNANNCHSMTEAEILEMARGYWAADLKTKYLQGVADSHRDPDTTYKSLYMLMKRRGILKGESDG